MIKTLRSIIHEKLPLDLRVQIDLLSRRRDIVNEEKHQELIKLLQKFEIEDIVKLGPGTNRYAFKLCGFVVKVATDHDGKIDNFKEFKMAKRLFPYVTKTYEVSKNGTILIAEYIQPFQSYAEMCKYGDQIREILTKLSSVYLIGDVGVTSTNYSNWGLRIGTQDPVCLDFAYVYEVSSELFICRRCNTNSMLVPNKDFTELHCPNKGCGQRYKFEDIRARIGNDIHRHEIGDLSDEGYEIIESNVITELDDKRSNYLARKKDKEKEKPAADKAPQETVYDSFVMEHPPRYYIDNHKEDLEMSILGKDQGDLTRFRFSNGMVIQASAVATVASPDEKVIRAVAEIPDTDQLPSAFGTATAIPIDNGDDETESSSGYQKYAVRSKNDETGLAFSGTIDQNINTATRKPVDVESLPIAPATPIPDHMVIAAEARKAVVLQRAGEDVEIPAAAVKTDYSKTPTAFTEGPEYKVPVAKPVPVETVVPKEAPMFNSNFLNNMDKAFSKLSNRIGNHMHVIGAMDIVRGNIKDRKMYPETFYKGIQNAIYRSLVLYCNFEEKDVPNQNGNGTHKAFIPPEEITGMPYENTMIFISRFWNNRDINSMEDPEDIMYAYRDRFKDYRGIQRDFTDLLVARIIEKLPIDRPGAVKIANIIAENWCAPDEKIVQEGPLPTAAPVETTIEAPKSIEGTYRMDEPMDIPSAVEVVHNPNDDEEPGDGEDGEEYEDSEDEDPFSVLIIEDDDFDIIKINTDDAFGRVSIPIYTRMADIDTSKSTIPSIADDRNGVWDWLIHMVPDMMFLTKDPERWLAVNEDTKETNHTRIVIMDVRGDEYVMGIFCMLGIFIIDGENDPYPTLDMETLKKLNKAVNENIGYGNISHLRRSLSMESLIREEKYISDVVEYEYDEEEEEEMGAVEHVETGVSPEIEETEAERAAIRAVLGQGAEIEETFAMPGIPAGTDTEDGERIADKEIVPPEVKEPVPTPVVQQPYQEYENPTPGVFKPIRRKDRERERDYDRGR